MAGNYKESLPSEHMASHKGPCSVSMAGTFTFRLHSWKLSTTCVSHGEALSLDALRYGSPWLT